MDFLYLCNRKQGETPQLLTDNEYKTFLIMTTQEKRQLSIDFRNQMITIINQLLEDSKPTQWAVDVKPESEGFEDACKFVDLRYELSNLKSTLKYMNKYSNILLE